MNSNTLIGTTRVLRQDVSLKSQPKTSRDHIRRVYCTTAERPDTTDTPKPLLVKSTAAPRTAAPSPKPAPIEHSSTYLIAERRRGVVDDDADIEQGLQVARRQEDEEPFTGSAVEWMLRKADASLDEIEENPPGYAKALYKVSTGPVGTAAAKGVKAAADVTVQLGSGAVKAAAPAALSAGKWVLQQGAKAIFAAATRAISKNDKDKKG